MRLNILCFSMLLFLFACGGQTEEDDVPQWEQLKVALNALQQHDFKKYVCLVDSLQLDNGKDEILMMSLHQKYLDENTNDTLSFQLNKIEESGDSAVNVFYKSFGQSTDTSFCVQKMVCRNGVWKLSLK